MPDAIRVLYIDDDAALGRLMERILTRHGMAIGWVAGGAEGVEALRRSVFDAIALDHDLGNESGLQVLAMIRAEPSPPPVIYVTGSDDARVAVAALKAGAVDYVWKDVQGHYRDLLVESIRSAVAQEKLRRDKEQADREVREARDRAELLLSEVNHRVANSLALVSALAGLQAKGVADESARLALHQMQARIAAIAGVHRRLYTSPDVRSVDMAIYLESLVRELEAAMETSADSHRLRLAVDGGQQLAPDKAVAVGVIVTELVTNAYKYAYPSGGGEIRIRLWRQGAELALSIEDDGVGWAGSGEAQGTGVGYRIINAMTANLKATLAYDCRHGGTRVTVHFAA
ncbi:MAG: response regulator [Geminicoccaceae bacterium]